MPLQLTEENGGRILVVHASGKLIKEDYTGFAPAFDRLVGPHGKLRVLFDLSGFHGWEADALWEEVKFDAKHFSDIGRLAVVGGKKWQHGMAIFCRPFTRAAVRYFDQANAGDAREWLNEA